VGSYENQKQGKEGQYWDEGAIHSYGPQVTGSGLLTVLPVPLELADDGLVCSQ
jgi:hypothetical protein